MAERRMFTEKITESDAFLEMPVSSQALYFHLCMNADDDGFVKNPKRIARMIGASDDDSKLLIVKRFILPFESGVIVIKHWRMHNLLRKDRYKPTEYLEEKSELYIKENGAYTFDSTQGKLLMATSWQPNDNQLATQDSIGKDSIDNKVSKKEEKEDINVEDVNIHAYTHESYDDIIADFEVSEELRPYLIEFIKHCQINHKTLTNDKLKNIIVRLDMNCQTEQDKIQSIERAISGGYFDIAEGRLA